MTIKGDSGEYELLTEAVKSAYKLKSNDYYLTCEIGVREGLGSKIIMDEMKTKNHGTHHHIGIDPYGDIKYRHFDKEHDFIEHPKTDYTNLMKLRLKKDLIDYPNFHLMEMTDCEFMYKYRSGLTIYENKPKTLSLTAIPLLLNVAEHLLKDLGSGSLIENKTFFTLLLIIDLTQGGVFP